MLTIKLARKGKKGLPMYRLIISEKGRDTYGNPLEILGSYNPHTKKLDVQADRVRHWLAIGAQMTGVINNLLINNKIIEGEKLRVSRLSKKARAVIQKKADEDKKKSLEAKKEEAKAAEVVATPEVAPEATAEIAE